MKSITPFQVYPKLPENISLLEEIAFNLFWSWDPDMIELFRRVDQELWEETKHNPVLMLGTISQQRLEELSENDSFVAHVKRMKEKIDRYMEGETWFHKTFNSRSDIKVAYFSLEFGVTECVQVYSGGLGVLAGDHLKSASDLGIPLVGVGLLYQQGYFRQYLNIDGWQQELYPKNDFYNMPIRLVKDDKGKVIKVTVEFPGRSVLAQVWMSQIGRIPLYLLDTNLPENSHDVRELSYQLYGGDKETRIQQELLLGVGGIRALEALGIYPDVCHMNEGHAAFLTLEKLREVVDKHNVSTNDAIAAVKAGCVFTTHTPVPAGIDTFEPTLAAKYLKKYADKLGITLKELLAFGRLNPDDEKEPFNMAFLAMHLSSYCNGVSKLHAEVSRNMWKNVWPGVPIDEIPITSITNGVHVRSWISHEMADIFDRYLGTDWIENPSDQNIWEQVEHIPPEEIWRTHERRRERLVAFARSKLREHLEQRGASPFQIMTAKEVLDPHALTIGFARRFATYKRGTLFLTNPDRLMKILLNKEYPIQFIFAGKAHPKDEEGKKLIKDIIHFSRDPQIRQRVVFLEDYDMNITRYMVSGVDVWLNNPLRPLEASGTSGMKAMYNGVVNCSVVDGWWAEAFDMGEDVGWSIGKGEVYEELAYQNQVESNALYNILEKEIIPLYYQRGDDGIPWGWIKKMKESMKILGKVFNTNRMVCEYANRFYVPAAQRYRRFTADNLKVAKEYIFTYDKVRKHWNEVKILHVESDVVDGIYVNAELQVRVEAELGTLGDSLVDVQIYFGSLDSDRNIVDGNSVSMEYKGIDNGKSHYVGKISSARSGLHGYTIRIVPKYLELVNPYEWHIMDWEK
ncbi:alpha-glucan family phosphorylase [candidate division KSB1 bacterium]